MDGSSKILLWSVTENERKLFFKRLIREFSLRSSHVYSMEEHRFSIVDNDLTERMLTAEAIDHNIDGCYCYKKINKEAPKDSVPYVHYLTIASEEEYVQNLLADEAGYLFFIVDCNNVFKTKKNELTINEPVSDDEIDFEKYKDIDVKDLLKQLMSEDDQKNESVEIRETSDDYIKKLNTSLNTIYGILLNYFRMNLDWNFYLILLNFPKEFSTENGTITPSILASVFSEDTYVSYQQLYQYFDTLEVYPISPERLESDDLAVYFPFVKALKDIERKHWESYQYQGVWEKLLFSKFTNKKENN